MFRPVKWGWIGQSEIRVRTETEKMCARPEIKLKQCSQFPGRILRSGNENQK